MKNNSGIIAKTKVRYSESTAILILEP